MAKFKSRARSLDMLGRQQIAGIPTALNELFKNAHDAYADNVDVDFYRKSNIVLIRDNGLGMTRDDFENRWLTIGTESKLETNFGISKPYIPEGKDIRPVMGEKGVGRLAIAIIGPQVLTITRAIRENGLHNYVVSFINWTMFELPGIDLDEITIPVKEFSEINSITHASIAELVEEVKSNLEGIAFKTDIDIVKKIKQQLNEFRFEERILKLNYGPSLSENNHGTLFYIQPANNDLVRDIEDEKENDASSLHKMLCGFTNTMSGKNIPIKAEFRDHLINGVVEYRISEKTFFTPEDYNKLDHHIKGAFDEFGNFNGTISIYHKEPQNIKFVLNTSGKELSCGPFNFEFGYLQGKERDSILRDSEFTSIQQKMDKMGGLYIYRDGIRILPYGCQDFDFLDIEKNRTKSASYYFFSYRRMMGAIDITREHNHALTEKAGREGFMNNLAYREFRKTLMDFLVQIVQKYFREEGAYADDWKTERDNLNREYSRLERRKKQVSEKTKSFKSSLENYFKKLERHPGKYDTLTCRLYEDLESILFEIKAQIIHLTEYGNIEDVAEDIIALEAKAYNDIKRIKDEYTIIKPNGVGLTKNLERDWLAYQKTYDEIVAPKIKETEQHLISIVGTIAKNARIHLNARIRLEKSLNTFRENGKKKVSAEENNAVKAKKNADEFIDNVRRQNKRTLADLETKFNEKIASLKENSTENDYNKIRMELEEELDQTVNSISKQYTALKSALENVQNINKDNNDDTIAAIETKLENMEEQYASSLESMQIGMAIKVINHEFSSNVKAVRDSIKALQNWANANQNLKGLYTNIRDGFDHLDNYLNLFTPLEKRFQKRRTQITGASISDFIDKLYGDRFERHKVTLTVSDRFKEHFIESYASTIYPVFINLIDNSIFWLSSAEIDIREIILDIYEGCFSVTDTGPGISPRDAEYIFDFGYTRKLSGGGMGLFISKSILNKENLDIELIPNDLQKGAQFIIKPLEKGEE